MLELDVIRTAINMTSWELYMFGCFRQNWKT